MSEHDARDRFGLYRLCECPTCEGRGRDLSDWPASAKRKCPDCRGEGRIREEVASCATAEAVGVALVTLARESAWDGCPFGLLDREGETNQKWLILPWPETARTVRAAAQTLARHKGTRTTDR